MGGPDSLAWSAYYRKTAERAVGAATLFALDRFEGERQDIPPDERPFALDLGCGSGRDTIEMLGRGWRVLAVDAEPAALEYLRNRPDLPAKPLLETRLSRFEDLDIPAALFVNSSFALPLCPSTAFFPLWARILDAVQAGGRIVCQLFGERDSWADPNTGKPGVTFLSRKQAEDLLTGLKVELFSEEEKDTTTPRGKTKHWHVFHVVARKPNPGARPDARPDGVRKAP